MNELTAAGDALLRWSIRLGLFACAVSLLVSLARSKARGACRRLRRCETRWWSLGCALYLLHLAAAFHFAHGWSLARAYRHTAEQTAAVTGLDWGGGVYVNLIFTGLWLIEVIDRWRPLTRKPWPGWLDRSWWLLFGFMVVNASIVFVTGPVRRFSVAGLLVVAVVAWRMNRQAGDPAAKAEQVSR